MRPVLIGDCIYVAGYAMATIDEAGPPASVQESFREFIEHADLNPSPSYVDETGHSELKVNLLEELMREAKAKAENGVSISLEDLDEIIDGLVDG